MGSVTISDQIEQAVILEAVRAFVAKNYNEPYKSAAVAIVDFFEQPKYEVIDIITKDIIIDYTDNKLVDLFDGEI